MSLSGHWFELRGWIFLRQGENPAFFVLYERTERPEAKASQIQLQRKGYKFGAKRWGSGHGLHRKGALSRKTISWFCGFFAPTALPPDCRPGTEVKHREERRYDVQKSERPSGHQQRRRRTWTQNAFAGTARRRIPTRQAGSGPHRRCRDVHHSAALSSSGQAAERPQHVRLQPGIPGEGAPRRGIVPRLLRAHTGTY